MGCQVNGIAYLIIVLCIVVLVSTIVIFKALARAFNQGGQLVNEMSHRLHCTGPIIGTCNGRYCPWNPINRH